MKNTPTQITAAAVCTEKKHAMHLIAVLFMSARLPKLAVLSITEKNTNGIVHIFIAFMMSELTGSRKLF
jgi:hypothetical protein